MLTPLSLSSRKLFKYNKFFHQFSEHAEVSAAANQTGPAPKNGRNFARSNMQNMYTGVSLEIYYKILIQDRIIAQY
jgi:hypothetical protein